MPDVSPIPALPATTSVADLATAVRQAGAAIVEGLVDLDVVETIAGDLDPWLATTAPGSRSADPEWELFHGRRTVRLNGLAAKSSAFVDLAIHPLILGWADSMLIPDGGSIQVNDTQLIAIRPDETAQYLHRDQSAWPWFNQLLPDGPEVTVVAMVALTDCTAANGATRIVPGSHRRADHDDLFDDTAAVPAEMAAGSVLFFTGKTVHGGGANHTTDQTRSVVHLSYVLGWLRTEEAHPLALPTAIAARMPPRARELFGFSHYDPAPQPGGRLWLVDFENPAALLDHHLQQATTCTPEPPKKDLK